MLSIISRSDPSYYVSDQQIALFFASLLQTLRWAQLWDLDHNGCLHLAAGCPNIRFDAVAKWNDCESLKPIGKEVNDLLFLFDGGDRLGEAIESLTERTSLSSFTSGCYETRLLILLEGHTHIRYLDEWFTHLNIRNDGQEYCGFYRKPEEVESSNSDH